MKKIVITHLPIIKNKDDVFALAKRSRELINAIVTYKKELEKNEVEIFERHVNILRTSEGYFCAFHEDDLKKNRTIEKEAPTPFKGIDGRMKVALINKQGASVIEDLALLVAKVYIANPDNYEFVGFKDKNPENCKAENLFWSETKQ